MNQMYTIYTKKIQISGAIWTLIFEYSISSYSRESARTYLQEQNKDEKRRLPYVSEEGNN